MKPRNMTITEKYAFELEDIDSTLKEIQDGRVYEISKTQSDGFISGKATKLKKMIYDLLTKIQNDKPSDIDFIHPKDDKSNDK